jgi:hypothetical protein
VAIELEKEARDLIRAQGVTCEYYAPERIPEALVTVKRTPTTGSTRFSGRAMLTLQAWATTRGGAEELCFQAVDILVGRGEYEQAGGLTASVANVTRCSPENGPYRWDDPDVNDRKRWQATVSVDFNE